VKGHKYKPNNTSEVSYNGYSIFSMAAENTICPVYDLFEEEDVDDLQNT